MVAKVRKKKQRKTFTWKSDETRARSMAAGAANLAKYRAERQQTGTYQKHGVCSLIRNKNVPPEIAREVEEIERQLLSDLHRNPTGRELALIKSATFCLSIMHLGFSKLSNLRRFSRNKWLLPNLLSYLNALRLNLELLGGSRRTLKKLEEKFNLPPVTDADERAEADRIVQEFIEGSKRT